MLTHFSRWFILKFNNKLKLNLTIESVNYKGLIKFKVHDKIKYFN